MPCYTQKKSEFARYRVRAVYESLPAQIFWCASTLQPVANSYSQAFGIVVEAPRSGSCTRAKPAVLGTLKQAAQRDLVGFRGGVLVEGSRVYERAG